MFSYELGKAGDGVVPLESQIPMFLQKEAKRIYGYNAQHADILSHTGFIQDLNEILHHSLK